MAAYRRVYDSRHLQADCKEQGSAPDKLGNRVGLWATFTFLIQLHVHTRSAIYYTHSQAVVYYTRDCSWIQNAAWCCGMFGLCG